MRQRFRKVALRRHEGGRIDIACDYKGRSLFRVTPEGLTLSCSSCDEIHLVGWPLLLDVAAEVYREEGGQPE